MMVLRGRVTSGIGDLAHWMIEKRELYAAKTGVQLYPGSVNVVLDEPWHLPADRIRLEPSELGIGMNIVPCEISGLPAFILRTDKNDAGLGDHPPTVIEIAAAVRLRDALGLADGDAVEILVSSPR